jgi:hypothetical protein
MSNIFKKDTKFGTHTSFMYIQFSLQWIRLYLYYCINGVGMKTKWENNMILTEWYWTQRERFNILSPQQRRISRVYIDFIISG